MKQRNGYIKGGIVALLAVLIATGTVYGEEFKKAG